MEEPSNCISAIYDILSSIFQTGEAWYIRRSKLRQSLDFLRQNSPILSKFETPTRQIILTQSALAQCDSAVRISMQGVFEVEISMENSPWIRQVHPYMLNLIEVRQCRFVTIEYYWHNVSSDEFHMDGPDLDYTNRIWFLILNPAFL